MLESKKEREYLLPAERIEQMTVPDIEKPYHIPLNWCWLNLLDSFDNKTDSKRKIKQKDYLIEGKYAIVDQGQTLIGGYTNDESLLFTGKTPIIIFGDHTRCVKYIDFPFAQGADGVKVLIPKGFFDAKAFYYALQSISIPNLGYRRHYPLFKNFYIPLPPMKEQQRIVERIESLFAKLDEAKEKAQAVVDGFEDRRAAILYQAFTGILTRTWANKLGIPETSWSKKRFDEVAVIKSNLVDPEEFQNFPHIAPDNIEKKTGRLLEYHTIAEDGMKSGKHRFYPGQILYSKIRPNLSKVVIVDFDGLCSADMYPIESKEGINTKYLWYYMLSEEFLLQASTAGSRSVLPKINQKELSRLTVRVTDPFEQEKIVTTLDQLFEKEQQIKDNAEQSLEQIEGIKKAILARAFRGELGTNDPNDESALELLKKVLSMEPTSQPRKKGVTLPKEISGELKTELERKIVKLFIQKETDSLPIKDLTSVSSKPFEVLETLHDLEKRQIIKRVENNSNTYELMR